MIDNILIKTSGPWKMPDRHKNLIKSFVDQLPPEYSESLIRVEYAGFTAIVVFDFCFSPAAMARHNLTEEQIKDYVRTHFLSEENLAVGCHFEDK